MPCFITNHYNHLDSDPQSFEGGKKVTNSGSRIANKGINLVPPSGPTNPSAMVMSCFMTNHCDHVDSDPQLFEGGKKVVNTGTKIANKGIIGWANQSRAKPQEIDVRLLSLGPRGRGLSCVSRGTVPCVSRGPMSGSSMALISFR
jgi:hypothetical protein